MTKIEDEVTIEKYLNAIVTINSTLGRLDVLRLHLNSMYDDKMANAIIESIMKELANVSGVDYKSINIELPKRKPLDNETRAMVMEKNYNLSKYNQTYPAPPSPCVVDIIEGNPADNINYMPIIDNTNNVDYANTILQTQEIKKKVQKVKEQKQINKSLGIKIDNETQNMTYKFVNSNTLSYVIYNRKSKEMIITFVKNGRTYKYYNIPIYMFDNLVNLDENGASAGSYFQQHVVKNKSIRYEEITDTMLIG